MKFTISKFRKWIDRLFDLAVLMKAVFGFFEILGGTLLIISGKLLIDNFVIDMAKQEIADDPNDLIASFLINSANNFYYDAHIFAIVYLLAHGIVNIFLAVSLFKNKMWAYLWAIFFFGGFIIYQTYRFSHTHSIMLLVLTIFDIFIVLMIWLEYNKKIKVI